MTTERSWPPQSAEHLADALREQGVPAQEIELLTPTLLRLGEWEAPRPGVEQTQRLLLALTPHLPTPASLGTTNEPARAPVAVGAHRGYAAGQALGHMWRVLVSQWRLLRRSVWLASALATALAIMYALALGNRAREIDVITFALPLIAATGTAFLYGPENDPGLELALATPTSMRLVLLGRFALLFGFDGAAALLGTALLVAVRGEGYWGLTSLWVGPMLLLAAASLVLSLIFGPLVAAAAAAGLWVGRYIRLGDGPSLHLTSPALWQTSPLTLGIACGLLVIALLLVPHIERLAGEHPVAR